jgi:hypothetical protein
LSEEVKINWVHLLPFDVKLFKAWHGKKTLKFLFLVTADIEQQIVAVVGNHRSQKPSQLHVSYFHLFCRHRVSEDGLPNVVVVLIHIPD